MEKQAAAPVPLPLPTSAIDHVFSFLYEELLQIARAVHRRDPSFATTTTALVNESWLRLRDCPQLSGISLDHFKAIAVKVMRRILVDAARKRNAEKRGAGIDPLDIQSVQFMLQTPPPDVQLLALDTALDHLERLDPRKAQIVDCHYFGGMTVPEVAEYCGLSSASVERDLRAAKAWLITQIEPK
jgi:RNA polymerase sigma factor (TIGR02999 family)